MYFSTCLFCLYVGSNICLSTMRSVLDTHMSSNVVIMTFNYDLFPVPVQNIE